MKESESIKKEMELDDSDNLYRSVSYLRKYERALKFESFESDIIPILEKSYLIEKYSDRFVIKTSRFGNLTYYPKANSMLIQNTNTWIKHYGLNWIKKCLIKNVKTEKVES